MVSLVPGRSLLYSRVHTDVFWLIFLEDFLKYSSRFVSFQDKYIQWLRGESFLKAPVDESFSGGQNRVSTPTSVTPSDYQELQLQGRGNPLNP